jgi:hypothetical protein
MTQQANVTLNSVVYAPNGTSNGVATWGNRSGGYAGSFSFLTEKMTTTNPDIVRFEFKLNVPIVETVGTGTAAIGDVLRTSQAFVTMLMPASSTTAERTDIKARMVSLIASTPFTDAVGNLDPAYG